MHYIIQILAAILIGTSLGAILGPRNNVLFIASLIAIALGIASLVTASWPRLAVGTAAFFAAKAIQRDTSSSRA